MRMGRAKPSSAQLRVTLRPGSAVTHAQASLPPDEDASPGRRPPPWPASHTRAEQVVTPVDGRSPPLSLQVPIA